jgi:hypothetical protein
MKNKNNPNDELKKIKGDIWYSETEKQFYTVTGSGEQKPVSDPKPILEGIEQGLRERTPFLQNVLESFGLKKQMDDKSKLENEDYFL